MALVGDSHAEHLFIGLSAKLPEKNIVVYVNRTYPFKSEKDFSKIYEYILQQPSIESVVIGVQWFRWFAHSPPKGQLKMELMETIKGILSSGKRVYLAGDIPIFPFSAERCRYQINGVVRTKCSISESKIVAEQQDFMSEIDGVLAELSEVKYLPMRDIFCTNGLCSMARDGLLMYRDEGHLNAAGSNYVAEILVNKLGLIK